MTTPVFKLTKGARNIDLQTGRYRVYGGWAPPPVSEIPLFAEGTSANRGAGCWWTAGRSTARCRCA